MTDHRIGLDLFNDVLDVLHRHGFARGDDQHAGRAIFLIGDLARIYEGSQDHPFGPYINEIPPSRTEPAPPEPAAQDAVLIQGNQVKTLLVALDIAADYQRDRAELCADCTSQSCPTCESRLQDAQAYDHLSAQLNQAVEASAAATGSQPEPGGPRIPAALPDPAADREAGQ
jgi:hypothetical protein